MEVENVHGRGSSPVHGVELKSFFLDLGQRHLFLLLEVYTIMGRPRS